MFHARGVFRSFFREGAPNFVTFLNVVFPSELTLSNLSTKNDSKESGDMLPRKMFENSHTVMASLVRFEQFLGKVCHMFGS